MVINVILLIVGMVLLIKGADFFVTGASNVAKALKIPSLIIGLTLVSVGTSAPELSVSITAAFQGKNDMSFGNVVGSNIFNTFVVIGASALFTPLVLSKNMKKYDIPILIGFYLLIILFGFVKSIKLLFYYLISNLKFHHIGVATKNLEKELTNRRDRCIIYFGERIIYYSSGE